MASDFTMRGVPEMKTRMRRFQTRFPDVVGLAMRQETEIELTEVKRRTPVDTGELRASEFVLGPLREGQMIRTFIVAGGPAAPYAIYVHEDPDVFHKVGQWKYIESVIVESRAFMGKRVARRIRINLNQSILE